MREVSEWFNNLGFERITPNLFLGAQPSDLEDIQALKEAGVDAVVSLCEESEYRPGALEEITQQYENLGWKVHNEPVEDFSSLTGEQLENVVRRVQELQEEGHTVYIHCYAGMQRSACVGIAVVALSQGLSLESARFLVQQERPHANPMVSQWEALSKWFENVSQS